MRASILTAGTWSLNREKSSATEISVAAEGPKTAKSQTEEFEQEQLHGLVQQLFVSSTNPAVRQVVFSAIDAETEVRSLCTRIAEILAVQTERDVAFIDKCQGASAAPTACSEFPEKVSLGGLRASAIQLRSNLFWLHGRGQNSDDSSPKPLHLYLEELRREFEYSIVAAPSAATSREPFAIARAADGIVLVLSAGRTRRATALRVKNELSGIRLFGTVLCEREFPIPWGIYRRL